MRRAFFALSLALLASPAAAQQDMSAVQIRVERVAPGVAVLFGAGGNIGLSYGEDGNVLIDDQFAPLTDKIVAAVATIDPDPVRYLVNTHWHFDHSGGNENLGNRGVVIVAHDNVRQRMAAGQELLGRTVPPAAKAALPVLTFADGVTFHLNGDTIRVHHVRNAHTDGDSLIHWSNANVLHMGDTFFNGMLPFIDLGSGGSIDGLLAALGVALEMTNEASVIIPGHGPVATRAELAAYRDRLSGLRDQVAAAIAAGRTLDQIKALRLAHAFGTDTDFIPPDRFVETLYESLRSPPHAHGAATHRH